MTDRTLFLGNGLNRTLDNGISWQELMGRLGSDEPDGANIPFPIEFEQIAARRGCQIGRRDKDPYKELREEIVKEISGLRCDEHGVHFAFAKLPFDHVVTTNYDQTFENQLRDLKPACKNFGSTRNILEAVSTAGGIDIYHAHGIDKLKRTLCLGHEHYISLIGKIRRSFYPNGEEDNGILRDLVKGEMPSLSIWPEFLFTSDVAIVGFGLDYCETDIWWLLALRAALFSPYCDLQSRENAITFYEVKKRGETRGLQDSCHARALESLGVKVQLEYGKTYAEGYLKIAEAIKESWAQA